MLTDPAPSTKLDREDFKTLPKDAKNVIGFTAVTFRI